MDFFNRNLKFHRLVALFLLAVIPLFFQNCGDVDVSRSLSLGSENEIEEELEIVEEVEEVATPEPEVPVVPPPVPKVTRFEFTSAMAAIAGGTTVDGLDLLIPGRAAGETVGSGYAEFTFTVEEAGEYVVDANVLAVDVSSNSYFANMDVVPTGDMVWHMLPDPNYTVKRLTRGGTADIQNPEHRFIFNEGVHVLKIHGRESNMRMRGLVIDKVP